MKTKGNPLLSFLLCAVLLCGALFPAHAADRPAAEPTWQTYIESVAPKGNAPYAKLKLTPKQYVFTDWRVPTEYDVTMKDGAVRRVTVNAEDPHSREYAEGAFAGYRFSVDAGDETLTFYAVIRFDRDTEQCAFEIGQWVPDSSQGTESPSGVVYIAAPISSEPCKTEIDPGGIPVRVLYLFTLFFEKIQRFFLKAASYALHA